MTHKCVAIALCFFQTIDHAVAEPFVLDLAISFFAPLRYFIHPRKLATLFDCAQALHERVLVVSESRSVNMFQSFGPSFDTAFTRT